MLAAALIVFREVLESALIISIVMAASKGTPGRNAWVGGGIAGGLLGAGLVAAFASVIANAASGMGQELFNAIVLGLAALMLGWHNVWMAQHGREMAQHAGHISKSVHDGTKAIYALAIVCGVAVLREGSETVLFMYGIMASGKESWLTLTLGSLMGIVVGVAIGVVLYKGLVRIPVKRLFTVSGWMILLLASGLAAQSAGFLVQADMIPALGEQIWDTSHILSESSLLGQTLHTLVGYIARPSGVQLLVYALTFGTIAVLMKAFAPPHKKTTLQAACVALALLMGAGMLPTRAEASFKVRSPIVDYRELEIEQSGFRTFDSDDSRDNKREYGYEIGYGITPWWKVSIEAETKGDPHKDLYYSATALENTFQLTPQGKYWADVGLYVEYGHAARDADHNTLEIGPLVQKETSGIGKYGMLHIANLLFERNIENSGSHPLEVSYALQSRLRYNPLFEPGIEIFGEVEDAKRRGKWNDQEHRIGPMFAGVVRPMGGSDKIKYEFGYLLPLTDATENATATWKLEYELAF